MKVRFFGCLAGIALTTACSSSYEPARSPRVATIWSGGHLAYVRDGQRYSSSFIMGNAALDAVQGNPRAEAEARTGRNLEIGGLVFVLAGLGAEVGAVGTLASSRDIRDHESTVNGLLIAAIASDIVAISLSLSAIPHFYDAVNIYNDDLDRGQSLAPQLLLRPVLVPLGPRSSALPLAAPSNTLPPPPAPPSAPRAAPPPSATLPEEAAPHSSPPAAAFPPTP